MPLYKVEIIEERLGLAFVQAASASEARTIIARAGTDGDLAAMMGDDVGYCTGEVEEIEAIPEGYEVDFASCGAMDHPSCNCGDIEKG